MVSIATQLNSTRRRVELSCVAINGPLSSETAGPTSTKLGTYIQNFMACGTKLLGSGIWNFGPCTARGQPELSLEGRDDPPRPRVLGEK